MYDNFPLIENDFLWGELAKKMNFFFCCQEKDQSVLNFSELEYKLGGNELVEDKLGMVLRRNTDQYINSRMVFVDEVSQKVYETIVKECIEKSQKSDEKEHKTTLTKVMGWGNTAEHQASPTEIKEIRDIILEKFKNQEIKVEVKIKTYTQWGGGIDYRGTTNLEFFLSWADNK